MSTALSKYRFFDSRLENELSPYIELVASIFGAPIAYLSVFDDEHQYFISKKGIDLKISDRSISLCNLTLKKGDILVINDLKNFDNLPDPIYKNFGYYVGKPIFSKENNLLATICAMGNEPADIPEDKLRQLELVGEQILGFLRQRRFYVEFIDKWQKKDKALKNERERIDKVKHKLVHDVNGVSARITGLLNLYDEADEAMKEQLIEKLKEVSGGFEHVLSTIMNELTENQKELTEKINLNEAISQIITLHDFSKYGEYEIEVDELPTISANPGDIHSVLYNLIDNGLKYNDTEKKVITIDSDRHNGHRIIRVQDNGIGMEGDDFEKIFERSERLEKSQSKPGHGLGLYNVKRILEDVGGKINVESEIGKGTKFEIFWPVKLLGE